MLAVATTPTREVYVIIHHAAGQRPDQLQGGTAGADRTRHDGGRANGGSSDNEEGSILLQHDLGAGLRSELRQPAAVYQQNVGVARRRQPYLQSSCKVYRAKASALLFG